jgi:uncharacterized membrane protein
MFLRRTGRYSLGLLAALSTSAAALGQTEFFPLGYLDGNGPTSEANAVTADGERVVGYSTTSLTQNLACWWTSAGIEVVPGVQNWLSNSAYAVSADGNVIVGDRSFGGTEEAFFWTPAGKTQLVPFPEMLMASTARGITGDGQVVVGTATKAVGEARVYRAFRWDRSQAKAVFLPSYSSQLPSCGASDVSDDGRRIVGAVQVSLSAQAAALWQDGGKPVLFSREGDSVIAVTAYAISPDGSVVVGAGVNAITGKDVAFKWTAAGGVVGLPNPTTGHFAIDAATALAVSGDGHVVVGFGVNVAGDDEAIIWVDAQPYRVADVANAAGVLPPSWEPFRAHGVDYYGNLVCGYGRATSGKLEAYALIIDATPPSPPLVAPQLRSSYDGATGTLTIRYQTVPGLRYRVHGGSDLQSLPPLAEWSSGIGIERQFQAGPSVTGSTKQFYLRVEVAPN